MTWIADGLDNAGKWIGLGGETGAERKARVRDGETRLQGFADRLYQSYAAGAHIKPGEQVELPSIDELSSMEDFIVLVAMMRTRQMDERMSSLINEIKERAQEFALCTNALIYARAAQSCLTDKSERTFGEHVEQALGTLGKVAVGYVGAMVIPAVAAGVALYAGVKTVVSWFKKSTPEEQQVKQVQKAEKVLDEKPTLDASPLVPWLDNNLPGWRDQVPADIRCQNLFPGDVWAVLETKIEAFVENIAKDIEALINEYRNLNGQYGKVMQKAASSLAAQGNTQGLSRI